MGGAPDLAESQSFLLSLSQNSLEEPQEPVYVQVIMSLGVLVNVAPFKGTPQIKLVGTAVEVERTGKRLPTIKLKTRAGSMRCSKSRQYACRTEAGRKHYRRPTGPDGRGGSRAARKAPAIRLSDRAARRVKAVQADIDYSPKSP